MPFLHNHPYQEQRLKGLSPVHYATVLREFADLQRKQEWEDQENRQKFQIWISMNPLLANIL